MNPSNIQQCLSGFKTTAVLAGPYTVMVHEALDSILGITKHRYFISVDFKFKTNDALYIGTPGWLGVSKSEATKEAKQLCAKLTEAAQTAKAADEHALEWDTFTNRYTAKLQNERLQKLVGKYTAEFIPNI